MWPFARMCSFARLLLRHKFLGGGNSKIFGIFTPKLGEDEPNLTSIFFRWVILILLILIFIFISLSSLFSSISQPSKMTTRAEQQQHLGLDASRTSLSLDQLTINDMASALRWRFGGFRMYPSKHRGLLSS